jgi:hypothetical protein
MTGDYLEPSFLGRLKIACATHQGAPSSTQACKIDNVLASGGGAMRKLVVLTVLALALGGAAVAAYETRWLSAPRPGHQATPPDAGAVPVAKDDLPDAPWLDYKLTPVDKDAEMDDAKCRSYGAPFGTPRYVDCRVQLDTARTVSQRSWWRWN